jgi:hypothetical protein
MTEADLLDALRDCYSPGTGTNILAANLVRAATVARDDQAPGSGIPGVPPRYIASISLIAPGSDEGLTGQLVAQIYNRLAGMEQISRTDIKLLPPLFPIL